MVNYVKSISERKDRAYIYEATTPTFCELNKYYQDIIGSEYMGENHSSGEVMDGILHEDALELSFENERFDIVISADVFEHVADYKKALRRLIRDKHALMVSNVFKYL